MVVKSLLCFPILELRFSHLLISPTYRRGCHYKGLQHCIIVNHACFLWSYWQWPLVNKLSKPSKLISGLFRISHIFQFNRQIFSQHSRKQPFLIIKLFLYPSSSSFTLFSFPFLGLQSVAQESFVETYRRGPIWTHELSWGKSPAHNFRRQRQVDHPNPLLPLFSSTNVSGCL